MNTNFIPAPIDEKNICGSFLLDDLKENYEAVMSKEIGRTTCAAVFVGKNIVRIDWTFGTNEIKVYGDKQIAVQDVALYLRDEFKGEFLTKCFVGENEVIIKTYFKSED